MTSGQLQRQYVDVNITEGHCVKETPLVQGCVNTMNYYLQFAQLYGLDFRCRIVLEGLDCIEEVMCRCNYGSNHTEQERGFRALMIWYHYFNTLSQCGNDTWGDGVGSSIIGAIEVNVGVNCSVHNPKAGSLSLVLAISEVESVTNVTQLCAPMNVCYQAFDKSLTRALYQHDWPEFCRVNDELLGCLVNASCGCSLDTNEDVVDLVNLERQIYSGSCSIITGSSIYELEIFCPGDDVCEKDSPNFGCISAHEKQAADAESTVEFCNALYELADCTETLSCDCGFYQQPYYYRSLAVAKYYYIVRQGCAQLTGPFPNHTGLACKNDSHLSAEEKQLVVQLENAVFIMNEEANCTGIKKCYDTANAQSTTAHRNKDLQAICKISADLILCLEAAYCDCDRILEPEVRYRMDLQRDSHKQLCVTPKVTEAVPKKPCFGPVCDQDNPHLGCLQDYLEIANTAPNRTTFCKAVFELADCTETLACKCGFYKEPYYYRSLAISKYYYINGEDCESVTGPFPNHTNLACKDDGRLSEDQKLLIVELADAAFVVDEEAKCSGVKACYDTANAQTTVAHRMKDLEAICEADKQLIECLDDAYCNCSRNNDRDVNNRMLGQREIHAQLCRGVIVLAEASTCRGQSTCAMADPLTQCSSEFRADMQLANDDLEKECVAVKDYIVCREEVACTCGLLEDAGHPVTEAIYNQTTFDIAQYQSNGCGRLIGGFSSLNGGISCESGRTGNPDSRRLVLNYAESDEVASHAEKCAAVVKCFKQNDVSRRDALVDRNFEQLCRAQTALVGCLDQAYCGCRMANDTSVQQYLTNQISTHNQLCQSVSPIGGRQECTQALTGGSNTTQRRLGVSLLLAAVVMSLVIIS